MAAKSNNGSKSIGTVRPNLKGEAMNPKATGAKNLRTGKIGPDNPNQTKPGRKVINSGRPAGSQVPNITSGGKGKK